MRYFSRAAAPVQIGFYPKLGATEKSEGSPPTDGPPAGTLNPKKKNKKDRDSEERMKTRSSQGETKAASKTVPTTPTTACNYCVSVAH